MRRFLIILSGCAVVALCVGWFLRWQAGNREFKMRDGSIITVEKVSYGQEEQIYLGGSLDRLKAAMPPAWTAMFPSLKPSRIGSSWTMGAAIPTNADALYIYISRREPDEGYDAVRVSHFARVIDEDGCVFFSSQSGGYDDGQVTAGNGDSVGWFRFDAFPRRDKKFRFLVQDLPQGRPTTPGAFDDAEFIIANPAPKPQTTNWPVEPLPIVRTQGNVSFILTNVAVRTNVSRRLPQEPMAKIIRAEYAFAEDGQPSTNWEALETELEDGSGDFISGESQYQTALCPREPAWKMRVKFFGSDKSRAASNAVWTLRGVAVPAPGHYTLLDSSQTLQGVPVRAVTFGGAGIFTYSNNIVLDVTPSNEPVTYNYWRQISVPRGWTGKNSISKLTFSLHVKSPHLALDVGDLSSDQRLTVRAVDDQGGEFYGYKFRPGPHPPFANRAEGVKYIESWRPIEGTFLAFDLPADAKTVDLTFCVHTGNTAEFIFKPPDVNGVTSK